MLKRARNATVNDWTQTNVCKRIERGEGWREREREKRKEKEWKHVEQYLMEGEGMQGDRIGLAPARGGLVILVHSFEGPCSSTLQAGKIPDAGDCQVWFARNMTPPDTGVDKPRGDIFWPAAANLQVCVVGHFNLGICYQTRLKLEGQLNSSSLWQGIFSVVRTCSNPSEET